MIETKVDGEVSTIGGNATWLRSTLKANVDDAADHTASGRSIASGAWEGDDADGYDAYAKSILELTDAHTQRIGRAATALDSYAVRLRQMKESMRGLRERAVTGGLTVNGTVIEEPESVSPFFIITGGTMEEYQTAMDKVTLYNTLVEDTEKAQIDFVDWIDTNLAVDVKDAQEKDGTDKVLRELDSLYPNFVAGVGAGLNGFGLRKAADRYHADAREFRRRSRVSGNPAVRGQAETPAGKSKLDDLMGKSRLLGRFGRIFSGPAGVGIDIYFGIREAQETGDWKRAALTTGTSIAVGVGVGALVAAGVITAPAWAVVVGAGALAAGAAWGVGKVYDNWDDITGWTGDRRDDVSGWTGDRWSDAKNVASDTWDDAADLAGDAWDSVTPW